MKHHIRDNQLILDVRVGVPGERNIETFRGMIDTGADITLISEYVKDKIGLKHGIDSNHYLVLGDGSKIATFSLVILTAILGSHFA